MTPQQYAAQTWPNYFPGIQTGMADATMQQYWNELSPFMQREAIEATGGGGGGGGGSAPSSSPSSFEDPRAMADLIAAPPFELPNSPEAMQGLRALQMRSVGDLYGLMDEDLEPGRQRIEDALFGRMNADIEQMAADRLQESLEHTFGRGVGESSVTGDYYIQPLRREQARARENARNTAFVTSGQEARANQATRLSTIGQAFNSGTQGLQGEANVGEANAARRQSANQAGVTTGLSALQTRLAREQQESQFGRGLAQQRDLQREAFSNAERIADRAATAGAIGSGIGGLAQFFAPAANNLLANQWPTIFGKPVDR